MKEQLRKGKFTKGFSLAELGIALVILLIVSTIAVISYFTVIDNAKEIKVIEEAKTIRLSLAREGITPEDVSEGIDYESLEYKVKNILEYHLSQGTNLTGMIFKNEVLIKDGNYIIGELKTPIKDVDNKSETALLNIFKPMVVKADNDINIDNMIIEVRKLDNNEMNKYFQEQLNGDWFIVDSVEEIKGPETVTSTRPYHYSNGLLDDINVIKNINIPLEMYDNDLTNFKNNGFADTSDLTIEFNYPVNIHELYIKSLNSASTIYFRFYDKDNVQIDYYSLGKKSSVSERSVELNIEGVSKIKFFRSGSNSYSRTYEIDFFGEYVIY